MRWLSLIIASALVAIGAMSQAQTIDELVDAARKAQGKESAVAFDNLAARGEEALPALIILMKDKDSFLSHMAIEHAIKYHDRRVLPVLIQLHKEQAEGKRRRLAGPATGQYFISSPDGKFPKKLQNELNSDSLLLAMGNHQNPDALPYLKKFAKTNKWLTRCNVAYALGRIGNPGAESTLRKLTKDKNKSVRWQAHDSLAYMKQMNAKYPKRLSDPNAWWKTPA